MEIQDDMVDMIEEEFNGKTRKEVQQIQDSLPASKQETV